MWVFHLLKNVFFCFHCFPVCFTVNLSLFDGFSFFGKVKQEEVVPKWISELWVGMCENIPMDPSF